MAEPTLSPHDPVIKPMALTLQGLRPVNRMNKKGGVAWSHTPTVRPDEIAAANRPAIPRPCCGEKENGIAAAIWLNHLILDSTRLNRSTKDSRLFKTSDFAREVLECWRSPQPLASYTFRRRTQNAGRRTDLRHKLGGRRIFSWRFDRQSPQGPSFLTAGTLSEACRKALRTYFQVFGSTGLPFVVKIWK
jgi:hypothetical protein